MTISESETVTACPVCDATKVQSRNGAKWSTEPEAEYSCGACGSHFDEPIKREANNHTNGGSELSSKLRKMDIDVNYE